MRTFSVLFFLALTSQAYGRRRSRGVASGDEEFESGSNSFGSSFGGSGGLSGAGSSGFSSSRAGFDGFPGSWPGTAYYGVLPTDAGISSGSSAASGSIGYAGSSGGNTAVSFPEGDLGNSVGLARGVGAGAIGAGVPSGGNAGTYGNGPGVGSLGDRFAGTVGGDSGIAAGLGSGAARPGLGSLRGIGGSALESREADLAARRRRAKIVGAVVGTALGGALLGGLIGGLGRLARTGRLRHSGYISGSGSTGYERSGDGYGYRSRYRSGAFYRGYRRGCTTCQYQRRPCFGLQCN
ncbi:uncharacterized protein LOC144141486 isoform X2 [Haemaphysalis longicornis]